jgi:alpha-galactosidase
VEVPILVDDKGLHPQNIGNLPTQCAALNMSNVIVQQLTAEAALECDTEKVVQALAMDPLTAAVLHLGQIRELAEEMLLAEAKWLDNFTDKKLAGKPRIVIPQNVQPVDVPVDPALAIANRFDALSKMHE